jgi:hypothetical protein
MEVRSVRKKKVIGESHYIQRGTEEEGGVREEHFRRVEEPKYNPKGGICLARGGISTFLKHIKSGLFSS